MTTVWVKLEHLIFMEYKTFLLTFAPLFGLWPHNSEPKGNTLTSLFMQAGVQYHITNPALLVRLTKHTRCELRQLRTWLTFTSTISAARTGWRWSKQKWLDPRPPDIASPSPGMVSLQITTSARSVGTCAGMQLKKKSTDTHLLTE